MANYNSNSTLTCIYISVMYYILHCMTQLIRMHMYNSCDKKVQRSITCTSRYIHVIMTNPIQYMHVLLGQTMYESSICIQTVAWANPFPCYVIIIVAGANFLTSSLFLEIVDMPSHPRHRYLQYLYVLLGQTMDDSSPRGSHVIMISLYIV